MSYIKIQGVKEPVPMLIVYACYFHVVTELLKQSKSSWYCLFLM